tara:strand:+ start:370 stop:5478 length:5109 start_codon:yes stop_codon:yes gene_type:complete
MATKYEQYMAGEITEDEFLSGFTTTPSTTDVDDPNFLQVFAQSIDELQATGFAGVRVLGEAFGNESLKRIGDEGVIRNEQQAAKYGRPMTIEDIDSVGSGMDWLFTNAIPQVIPSVVASLGLAVGGAALGAAAIPAAVGTAATRALIGGALGSFLPSSFLGAGEVDRELKARAGNGYEDPLAALGGGAVIGALDTAALAFGLKGVIPQIAKRTGLGDKFGRELFDETVKSLVERGVTPNIAGRAVAQGLAAAVVEGSTEASQEFLKSVIAENSTGVSTDEQELTSALINSFALGAVGGAPVGAFAGGIRAKSLKDNIQATQEYNELVETSGATAEQYALDTGLENLTKTDLVNFAITEFGTVKDWGSLNKSQLVEEIKKTKTQEIVNQDFKSRIEQLSAPELTKATLEREEIKRIKKAIAAGEVTNQQIVEEAKRATKNTYAGQGSVQKAIQDLAEFNIKNEYINSGKTQLLSQPFLFKGYIDKLATESNEILAVEANELLPDKYESFEKVLQDLMENKLTKKQLAKDIAEKKYNIQQNQTQLSYAETNTPITVTVNESGQQQFAAREKINVQQPEKSLIQQFTTSIKDTVYTFVKKEITSGENIVGYEYVDQESGKTFAEITNEKYEEQATRSFDEDVDQETEPLSVTIKNYQALRGDIPMVQDDFISKVFSFFRSTFAPVTKKLAPITKQLTARGGLSQNVFELNRLRLGRQRGLNKLAQQLALSYEQAADAVVLDGSFTNRTEIDLLFKDFLDKSFTRKPLTEEQKIEKRTQIEKLNQQLNTTTDELKKGALNKSILTLQEDLKEGGRVDVAPLEALPESMRQIATETRTAIDSLSERVLAELPASILDQEVTYKKGEQTIKETKRDIIKAQLGAYVTRSYKLFDPTTGWNPASFFGKRSKEQKKAFDVAVDYYIKDQNMSKEEATIKVNDIINQSINQEGIDPSLVQTITGEAVLGDKVSPINQFLQQREKLPPELKGLFGEMTNPSQIVATTVNRLTSYVENYNFYQKLLEENNKAGSLIFAASPTQEFNTEVPLMDSPIDGLYTTKELAEALSLNKQDKSGINKFYDSFFLVPKAIAQSFKTVYSVTAQVRNAFTASMFYMANGHLNIGDFNEAMKTVYYELSGTGYDSSGKPISQRLHREKLYKELQDLGIVNTNVRLQDMLAIFNEAGSGAYRSMSEFLAFLTNKNAFIGKSIKGVTKIGRKPAEIYSAADDFFKIAAFVSEKRKLKRAYENSDIGMEGMLSFAQSLNNLKIDGLNYEQMLNALASYKVRHTIPNYDYVGNFIKFIRKLPLGNFVAFPTEIIRTGYNIPWLAGKEIRSGNSQQMIQGYRRLLGFGTMAAGLPAMALAYGKAESGVDDEDIEAARRIMPDFAKNNFIIPIRKRTAEEGGGFDYMDGSHLFVYDTIHRIIPTVFGAAREGQATGRSIPASVASGIGEAIGELADPYLSLSIAPGLFADLFNNRKPNGALIANPEDTWGNYAKDSFEYAFEKAQPGFMQQLSRLNQGGKAGEFAFDKYGNRQEFDDAMLGLMGLKVSSVNPTQSLPFIISDFKKSETSAKRLFTKITYQSGAVSAEDVKDAFTNSQRASFKAQQNLYRDYEALTRLGLDKRQARKQFKDRIGNRRMRSNIMRGIFTPYKPPKSARKNFDLATKKMIQSGAVVSPARYYPRVEINNQLSFYRRNRLNLNFEFLSLDDI